MELNFLPEQPVMEVKLTEAFIRGVLAGTINLLDTPNVTIGVEIEVVDITNKTFTPEVTLELKYRMADKNGTPVIISSPTTCILSKGDTLNLFNLESIFEVTFK